MPILVANGDNDLLVSTYHSWILMDRIKNVQLIIYPLAGHGFLYQYAGLFASHIHTFLDSPIIEESARAEAVIVRECESQADVGSRIDPQSGI